MKKGFKLHQILLSLILIFMFLLQTNSAVAMDPAVLPDDESPHPDVSTGWWYFTGHLYGKDIFGRSREYGFEVNIARTDALGFEPVSCIYIGHFGISDINRGEHSQFEFNINVQPNVIPVGGGFYNTVGLTHMNGKNGLNHITASLPDLSYMGLNIVLSQSEPTALHGGDGVIPYGPFGESGYYSQTKLKVVGTLIDHGIPVTITDSIAWHDRQWGEWAGGTGGWEWFSIQLNNNTEYMLYFIHDSEYQIVEKVGTLVNPDGTTVSIEPASISYTPHDTWTSPHTGNIYQMGWTVNVPGGVLTVTPQIVDQEMWNPLIAVTNYWEGSCTVTGTINGSPVSGVAYQEQTLMMTMQGSGSVWEALLDLIGL